MQIPTMIPGLVWAPGFLGPRWLVKWVCGETGTGLSCDCWLVCTATGVSGLGIDELMRQRAWADLKTGRSPGEISRAVRTVRKR